MPRWVRIVALLSVAPCCTAVAQTSSSPSNCTIAPVSNIVTCTTAAVPTPPYVVNAFTLTGGTTSSFSCGPVSPETQTVLLGAATQSISAVCAGATGYQWYTGRPPNGTAVTGATLATYTPPSSTLGTSTYYLSATKGADSAVSITGGTVTVQPGGSACQASGEPRLVTAFGNSIQLTDIDGRRDLFPTGPGRIFVTQITVSPTDTTVGRQLVPNFYFYYNDNSTFADRTMTLSRTCADFGPSSTALGTAIQGTVRFVTEGDSRASPSVPTLSPGVWYINLRSENCPVGVNCSFGAGWRASTF